MKTKLLVLYGLLISIMCAAVSGCGSNGSAVKTDGSVDNTIKWVMVGPGKQQDFDKVQTLFNEKLQDYLPGTALDLQVLDIVTFEQKWQLMLASNEKVDIMWTGFLSNFSEDVQKGAFKPLNELIDSYAPDLKTELPDWVWSKATIDGKIYQIPSYQNMNEMRDAFITFEDYADKYLDRERLAAVVESTDYNTPEFFAVLDDYFKKLHDNGELALGPDTDSFPQLMDRGFEVVTKGAAIKRSDASAKVVNYYEQPEVKLYFKQMNDWYKKEYIRRDALTIESTSNDIYKRDGCIATIFHYYKNSNDDLAKTHPEDKFTAIPVNRDYYVASKDPSSGNAMAKTCKNEINTIKFLDLMNTKKGADLFNLLTWGIEGEHYTTISERRIQPIGYEGQGLPESNYGLWNWAIGNTFIGKFASTFPEDWPEYMENEVHGQATLSPIMGFKPDTSGIITEITQVNTVLDTFERQLQIGASDDWEPVYEEMMRKLNLAGVDKIITEIQRQVDEFLGSRS